MGMTMWQTTELDWAIAEEFFGWKWLSFIDTPTKSTPGYPKKTRVRRFFSEGLLDSDAWATWLDDHDRAPATGDEPLAYCYCSSHGNESVPHYSGHHDAIAELEAEIRKRGLWSDYRCCLWAQVIQAETDGTDIDEERLAAATCEMRCVAALVLVKSKHVEFPE